MAKNQYVPMSDFVPLFEALLALKYARTLDSADYLAMQVVHHGRKVGYKPVGYMLANLIGGFHQHHPLAWKSGQAAWFMQNGPQKLKVAIAEMAEEYPVLNSATIEVPADQNVANILDLLEKLS